MTILVCRPSPDAEALAEQLGLAGCRAIAHPLLTTGAGREFTDVPAKLGALHTGDAVVAVSPNAVSYATDALRQAGKNWPNNISYFAVGRRTAGVLAGATGQMVISPPELQTSEGLLVLPELADMHGKRVVILRGNGGRDMIAQTLSARGAQVDYCECYQRIWLSNDLSSECNQWHSLGITTLVVTSGEQLAHLFNNVTPEQQQWLVTCHLLVPSARIASQAKQLGFSQLTQVESAANATLFNTLCELMQKGTIHND